MDGSWIFQGEEEGFCQVLGNFCVNLERKGREVLRMVLSSFCEQLYGGKTRFE